MAECRDDYGIDGSCSEEENHKYFKDTLRNVYAWTYRLNDNIKVFGREGLTTQSIERHVVSCFHKPIFPSYYCAETCPLHNWSISSVGRASC